MSHAEIDTLGPREALAAAMRMASAKVVDRLARAESADSSALSASVYHLVDGESVPEGLSGQAIVRGDQSEMAIAAASVVASVVHESIMLALARRWALWELEVNLGWPSSQHIRHIATSGPSGCHRASCFPFQRQQGRRMAYHPQRSAYRRIQGEIRSATLAIQQGGMAQESAAAFDLSSMSHRSDLFMLYDEATARKQRYKAFVAYSERSGLLPSSTR